MKLEIMHLYVHVLKFDCELSQVEVETNVYRITAYCAGEPFMRAVLKPEDVREDNCPQQWYVSSSSDNNHIKCLAEALKIKK